MAQQTKPLTIIGAMNDPALFKPWFKGESWTNWKVFLKALFCLPMTAKDRQTFTKFTGRKTPPKAVREAWLPVGRRGGKSLISALVAVYLACLKDYSEYLGPGERLTISVIAADRKQARVVMRYVVGFLESVPMLSRLVERKTQETVDLTNQVTIEVHTTSYRSVRGYTLGAVICDEISFWRSDESASPDKEIVAALRPGMASIPGSLLIAISSPYARRGMLWTTYKKHYGKDGSILVWQATTQDMNSTIDPHIIKTAYEEDPTAAAAEYGAEFRRDIEGFVSQEAVDAVVIPGRLELPPVEGIRYYGFCDPSGGSGKDSMTLGISHRGEKGTVVLDAVRERKPPFSPAAVTKEFADFLKEYRIRVIRGDRFGGEFPRELFRKNGVDYRTSERTKSEIYIESLALINSQRCELLDNPRLTAQLLNLERKTSRSGRDSVDHSPHSSDDVVNAGLGSLLLAARRKKKHDPRTLSFTAGAGKQPLPGLKGEAVFYGDPESY